MQKKKGACACGPDEVCAEAAVLIAKVAVGSLTPSKPTQVRQRSMASILERLAAQEKLVEVAGKRRSAQQVDASISDSGSRIQARPMSSDLMN